MERIICAATAGLMAVMVAVLTGCSVKFETGWHGQTGRDDRVISPTLYTDGVDQRRGKDQRY